MSATYEVIRFVYELIGILLAETEIEVAYRQCIRKIFSRLIVGNMHRFTKNW